MTIFVQYDSDWDRYDLMCADERMRPMPCGPRLFRAPPIPDIRFSHSVLAEAERDATKLRSYLAQLAPKKISKTEMRRQHA